MKIKINTKKLYNIGFRIALCVLVVVSIALVPTIFIAFKSPIEDKFMHKSSYQGVLEIWHIDTFEGGTLGKYQYLKARAIDFEKQNKGLFFMVKNMTETECLLALESGQMPSMFSFGVGVGELIVDYLSQIDTKGLTISDNFLSAGAISNNVYAVPWCRGVYSLISTTDRLKKQENYSSLAEIATTCGFTTKLKNNKTKTTYSLAFGSAGYVCPQMAYSYAHKNLVQNSTSTDVNNISKTPYSAYCDFIEGKANILLGTQRDIARVENRISQGKLDGVVYQHLTNYTDLVQFLGITKTDNTNAFNACKTFINYITSNTCQQGKFYNVAKDIKIIVPDTANR